MLHLGLFQNFMGETDTLLLSGEPADIVELSHSLGDFAASRSLSWRVHSHKHISAANAVELFASRVVLPDSTGFAWLCSPKSLPSIQHKLQSLPSSGSGHQYFGLVGTSVSLVVSVGEYSDSWWSGGA